MGEVQLDTASRVVFIRSVICLYGESASRQLAEQMAADIAAHWNEPGAATLIRHVAYAVRFEIAGVYADQLLPETVWYNDDPKLNFFRVVTEVEGNVSFVDGIGSNTGVFKLDNLLQTSTTAAHEYGHTIGLAHPHITDIRGGKETGIMYPRGTLCDSHLQYDPNALSGAPGGVLDPRHRRVFASDIEQLQLSRLHFNDKGFAQLGEFTSIYHG